MTQPRRESAADGMVASSIRGSVATRANTSAVRGEAKLDDEWHPPTRPGSEVELRGEVDVDRAELEDGRYVQKLADGRTVELTLDPMLQSLALSTLRASQAPYGAVVVMSTDGRVLALAGESSAETWLSTSDLTTTPWAPAASVFKLVTAAALVDQGVAEDERVCYHGGLSGIEQHHLNDDDKRDVDCNTFSFGIAKSQNAIMGKLAARTLEPAILAAYADGFGWNREISFALPVTRSKASIPKQPGLAFARVAAGFWQTELSALHGALVAQTIANGGIMVPPRLVDGVRAKSGARLPLAAPTPHRVINQDTADSVGRMMVGTTVFGTARSSFSNPRGQSLIPGVLVAGKTGSLSDARSAKNPDTGEVTRRQVNYSWFVGYAPADNPEVVVAVLLGNDPAWRMKAHAVAKQLLAARLAPPAVAAR